MDLVTPDGSKLTALMVAGAIFAGAGLWLTLRPKPEGAAAKIELFGLKFESSSAGLLVFLIGAAFLALPVLVEERPDTSPARQGGEGRAAEEAQPVTLDTNRPTPLAVDATEAEPNDSFASANRIPHGAMVEGVIDEGSFDYFFVEPTGDPRSELVVTLHPLQDDANVSVFDGAGEHLEGAYMGRNSPESVKEPSSPVGHYVLVSPEDEGGTAYRLTAASRPSP